MGSPDRLRQQILKNRRPHEMAVVGHQTAADGVEAEALAVRAEEFELRSAVLVN